MSKYCFFCLSDEGVFLNVTPNNYQSLYGEVETYLPVKIDKKCRKPIKVCYKCAYELKQCNDFVKKYKESRTNAKAKSSKKQCCNLCLESVKKEHIFRFNKHSNPLNDPLLKIKKLFDGNFAEVNKTSLICLTCRYTIDVLLDLSYLCQELSKLKDRFNDNIDYSEIPKVETVVIRRKTTNNPSLRIKTYVISESDSDSNAAETESKDKMSKISQSKQIRSCNKCHNSVQHGEDMYKFYKSGLTVCKTCWVNMDLNKVSTEKEKQNTKLCTVFLKDVFADTTLRKQKVHRVEKDNYGNKVYLITESESEVEVEDKIKISKQSEKVEMSIRGAQKRTKSETKSDSSESDSKSNKTQVTVIPRKRSKIGEKDKANMPLFTRMNLRAHTKKMLPGTYHHSDTDTLLKTSSLKSMYGKRRNISVSDVETTKKRCRTTLKILLENSKPLQDDVTSDESSTSMDSKVENTTNENERKRVTRASSVSTNESVFLVKNLKRKRFSKTVLTKSKLSKARTSPDTTDVDEMSKDANNDYTCNKCGAIHENKLKAATHELTHFKQLELKLHKVNIQNKLEEVKEVNELYAKQLVDELSEQQNEEITLSINDDDDIDISDVMADSTRELSKETCPATTENPIEDSLQAGIPNEEKTEESKDVDKIVVPVSAESTKTDEHKAKISETAENNELTLTFMENENTTSESTKDQIQVDNAKNEEEDKQTEINEEVINKERRTENAERTEIKDIISQQIDTAEIVGDTLNETEKYKIDEVKEDKRKNSKGEIEEKEDKIEDKEDKVGEKEDKVGEKEDKVGEKEDKVEEKEDKVGEKEDKVGEKEDKVGEKEDKVGEKEDKVGEKEDKVGEKEDKVGEKEDKVGEKEDKVEEKEDKVGEKEDEVEEKEDKIEEKEDKEEEKQNRVENIEKDKVQDTEKDEVEDTEKDEVENIEKDEIEDTEKEKVEDTEEDKSEKIEAHKEREEEQQCSNNLKDDQKDLNANSEKLNDTTETNDVESDNSSQEDQETTQDKDSNDKKEVTVKTVDDNTSESTTENNISICNVVLKTDNCQSIEEEKEQINSPSTNHAENESKCKDDVETLLNNMENTSSTESNKDIESMNKADMDAIDAATEMVEHIFNLTKDDFENDKSVANYEKRYNEMEAETLENISREIQKSADMPSLDPISYMEVDHNKLVN